MPTQSDALAINQAISDPVPRIQSSPIVSIELFRGVKNNDTGDWETTAVVSELTGEDEEALAALDSDDDVLYAQYMSALLKRSVVSIGNTSVKSNPAVIDSLIIGDRDALFLATVKATYGDTREYQINCPHCRESNDVLINLNEFPNRDVSVNPKEQIKIFLKNGTVQKFNLVTGADSQHVSKLAKSIPEQNTMLIARCADWEGVEKPADIMVWAKKLGMKDRAKIIDALLEAQPGPEIKEVDAHCAHCEKPFPIMLNWASLLFG
jgi:thiol-disulfide isomerase/thioredoxin